MKNFYYVRPTETSEADACSATFVAADHAKVICQRSYQPHSTIPFMPRLSKHVPRFFNSLLSFGLSFQATTNVEVMLISRTPGKQPGPLPTDGDPGFGDRSAECRLADRRVR